MSAHQREAAELDEDALVLVRDSASSGWHGPHTFVRYAAADHNALVTMGGRDVWLNADNVVPVETCEPRRCAACGDVYTIAPGETAQQASDRHDEAARAKHDARRDAFLATEYGQGVLDGMDDGW